MKKFFKSFVYAWHGILALFGRERNAKFHLVVAVLVIAAGAWFGISRMEWSVVMLCIGAVFMAEGMNTAIEKLCDKVSAAPDPLIRQAKDIAAGSVLLLVIAVVITGLLIFLPRLLQIFC